MLDPTPLVASILDQVLGDPPNRWHPVAMQGRLLGWAGRHTPRSEAGRFIYGAACVLGGAGLSALAGAAVERAAGRMPALPRLLVVGLGLKLALAGHGLDRAAGELQAALSANDLPEARRLLSWHLVSRPTGDLTAEEVAAAGVESVAENLTDAFVAPLCAWVVGGLPGVWAYRFVQTADSMWGYHDAEHEWLGKVAARTDDALNWLPARLSAALLMATAWTQGADAANAWQTRAAQARRTASPNAGQTMAAMAGALHVTLSKRGHYTLEGGHEPVTPDVLGTARRIVRAAAWLAVGLAVAGRWWRGNPRRWR
jgi:adenosylcobinamide-phosphate synthase